MNFKMFEAINDPQKDPVNAPVYLNDSQGKLRRTASVKVWDKIGIGFSTIDSRGVFCVDYIKEREIFEIAPIIILSKDQIKGTELMDYAFKVSSTEYAIAFGSASIYNHRNQPMATWKINTEKKTITFTALRDIEPGEEIFISYGKPYWNSREVSAKISPVTKYQQK